MGKCSVLLQLDRPHFIDTRRKSALSWMETEEEGVWVEGGIGDRDWEGRMRREAAVGM